MNVSNYHALADQAGICKIGNEVHEESIGRARTGCRWPRGRGAYRARRQVRFPSSSGNNFCPCFMFHSTNVRVLSSITRRGNGSGFSVCGGFRRGDDEGVSRTEGEVPVVPKSTPAEIRLQVLCLNESVASSASEKWLPHFFLLYKELKKMGYEDL